MTQKNRTWFKQYENSKVERWIFMIKRVKFLGALITLLIYCCNTAFSVCAVSDLQTSYNGEIVLTDDENEAYFNSLSIEEQEKIKEKIHKALNIKNKSNFALKNNLDSVKASKISIPGNFSICHQENDYYCVPACVRSMLMYINGSSPSQSSIASSLGTTSDGTNPTTIAPYLNSRQNNCYYVYYASPTQSYLCDFLYFTIAYEKCPASIGISGATASNWCYEASSHSLVVDAIYDDYSYIQVSDPLAFAVSGCPDSYLRPASSVASLCTRVVY